MRPTTKESVLAWIGVGAWWGLLVALAGVAAVAVGRLVGFPQLAAGGGKWVVVGASAAAAFLLLRFALRRSWKRH